MPAEYCTWAMPVPNDAATLSPTIITRMGPGWLTPGIVGGGVVVVVGWSLTGGSVVVVVVVVVVVDASRTAARAAAVDGVVTVSGTTTATAARLAMSPGSTTAGLGRCHRRSRI